MLRDFHSSSFAALAAAVLLTACAEPKDRDLGAYPGLDPEPIQRGALRKQSDKFSNIELITQHGESVRFYDDLIRDRAVLINLMYTTCEKICPANSARLAQIHDMLAEWMGDDLMLLSLSIDPEVDTPERLQRYWEVFGAKEGWLFLTGDFDEIDRLRHELGVYDPDPIIDADKTQHSGILTIGNDRSDRWAALPVLMHPEQLAMTILHTVRDEHWSSRAAEPKPSSSSASRPARSSGVVVQLHDADRRIVIDHEDIPGVMMAMTMAFDLDPGVDVERTQVGDVVEFSVSADDGRYVVTELMAIRHGEHSAAAADYATYCAACHGPAGDGDGPLAELLEPRPARHSDAAAMESLSDDELFLAIRDGGPAIGKSSGMGAWGDVLSDDAIRAIVEHIRTLAH